MPPSKPGRGTAQLYVADLQAPAGGTSVPETPAAPTPAHSMYRGPMSKRFDGKDGPHPGTPTSSAASVKPSAALDSHQDEASRIAAMFQATTEQWEETQERMSQYVQSKLTSAAPPIASEQACHDVVRRQGGVEHHHPRLIAHPHRLASFATDVVKKATGFKIVPRTTIPSTTIGDSNARPVFLRAC